MKEVKDPKDLANQLRKIEKDKRRKKYEDIQVQGTNNSSIVSKRSVEVIYQKVSPPGEWFKHFVPKGKRRSPAINRGYWVRMESIRQLIYRVIDTVEGPVNIINLGCGYDPLPFQLLNTRTPNLTFYDIDYPELVANKLQMILKASEILDLIGPNQVDKVGVKNGIIYDSQAYKLLGCDLKNHDLFQNQLQLLQPGTNIFIAEVSLAYMAHQDANKIIELSSKVENSHFIILEQILPNGKYDGFAQKMLAHFIKLRSSLKCVEHYPLKQDQISRFKSWYSNVEIKDLFENWLDLIDDDIKRQIHAIEDFDEWEEFIMFCQHYVIVHATNGDLVYKKKDQSFEINQFNNLTLKIDELPNSELKFPATCQVNDKVLAHGGLGQTRSGSTSINGQIEEVSNSPSPRMCHTFTTINQSQALVIGGRTKPGDFLKDVYKFDGNWTKLADLPVGVYRHEVIEINPQEVLILGGQESGSDLIIYNHITQSHRLIEYESPVNLSTLKSFGVWFHGTEGFIVGGLTDEYIPYFNNKLLKFTISEKVACELVASGPIYERVNPKLTKKNDELVIIGGINYHQSLNQFNLIISYKDGEVYNVKIPDTIWKEHPPLLIGHTVVHNRILYGGAVCYSFGSAYSSNYYID